MEQLMQEIEAFAARRGIKPATVLQYAVGLSGNVWPKWQRGASCQISTAEKIREYINNNSPSSLPDGVPPKKHGNARRSNQGQSK